MRQKHQLRLAALDCQLEVHQRAYETWIRPVSAVHTDKLGNVVIECQNWWYGKCLNLDTVAREAFYRAFRAASNHEILLHNLVGAGGTKEQVEKNWDVILAAGPAIEKAVELPPITNFKPEGFRE